MTIHFPSPLDPSFYIQAEPHDPTYVKVACTVLEYFTGGLVRGPCPADRES